jgi:putative transposase
MRSDYKRWKNFGQGGDLSFLTTTALDFNPVFARDRMKMELLKSIFSDCRHYEAQMHAYVVMIHHVHLLIRAPEAGDIRWLAQRLKVNSAKLLRPLLAAREEQGFDEQRHLNRQVFWKKGFRSVTVDQPQVFWQKVTYIHFNPVKAGVCEEPEQYRWSSATAHATGLWDPMRGLPLDLF